MNVLVIEDDRKIAGLLERGLSEHGHRVSVSGNGRQGVEMMIGGEFGAVESIQRRQEANPINVAQFFAEVRQGFYSPEPRLRH
jgi:DNA-binding NtrC family response regulator